MEREAGHPERRRQILDAALRVFSERGFGGASIRRISDEAGLNSPPLVYWYFRSKQDLFAATLAHFSARMTGFALRDRMDLPPEEVLPEVARMELRAFEDQVLVRLLRVAVAEAALDPVASERFFEVFRGEVLDFLTRYLELWGKNEGIQDLQPRTEALAFFGSLFFYVLNREVLPSFGGQLPDRDAYADAVVRQVLERFAATGDRAAATSRVPGRARPPVETHDATAPHDGDESGGDAVAGQDAGLVEPSRTDRRPPGEMDTLARPLYEEDAPEEAAVAGQVEGGEEPEDAEVAIGPELDAGRGPEETAEARPSGAGPGTFPASRRPFPADPPSTLRSEGAAHSGAREARGGVRKALFFVLPVRGHVQAALPVAQELASRGEEVVFYTIEEFEGLVRGAGVGFRVLDDDFVLPAELSEGYLAAPRALRPVVIRSIADSLRGVGRLAGSAREEYADYAVYDPLCPWGRLIPESLDLPAVGLYPTFVARENSPLARRLLPNLEGTPPPALVMPMVRLRWELREARSALGLPRLRPADLLLRPGELNIVTLPERFQPPTGGTLDERFRFVGPSILQRDERAYFSLKQIEARPTVFVSLGAAHDERTAGLYRDCLDGFASSRWLVVMETGAGADPALVGQAPPNVISWPRVPRLEVLRRCDVFVTDGDIGATMEALWFGVPLVVVPRTPEQGVTAERVNELRMGIVLDPRTTGADDLREAVDAVGSDPSYHSGLADLWVAARQAGGHRLAADSIQAFVARVLSAS